MVPESQPQALEELLASVKVPVRNAIQRILGSHFCGNAGAAWESVDDLASEVMLVLVRRTRELQADGSLESIQNFTGYAVTIASNVCNAYLRRRYPAWTRLKNQVRYLATRDPEIELRHQQNAPSLYILEERNKPRRPYDLSDPSVPLGDVIKAVIRNHGGTIELNELVSAIADVRGIRDTAPTPGTTVTLDGMEDRLADARPAGSPDDTAFLKAVWQEVQLLPLRQRLALLLNLRDDAGRSVLALFPLTATATMAQIAEALAIPPAEFANIWIDLPLDDARIAARLDVTRQQVINLRKAARARLARRLAAWRS
jgi:RNA polymerase sigma factor (sigma-70 family)